MNKKNFAKFLILSGPFVETKEIQFVGCRDDGMQLIKEEHGDKVLEVIFFDIFETHIDGLLFSSEPANIKHLVLVEQEEAEKRIRVEREKLVEVVTSALAEILPDQEQNTETKRTLH